MVTDKWFAIVNGKVKGPFQYEDLNARLNDWPEALVWGRGLANWLGPIQWREAVHNMDEQIKEQHQRADRMWRVLVDNQEMKPMSHDLMIQFLRTQHDLSKIRIWTEGYSEWKEVYQIHKIMDDLGQSRRAHPRVPIMGTLHCEGPQGAFTARLLSVSQGGLGATEGALARIGDKMKITLKSPNLPTPINATGDVVYLGSGGYFGVKFMAIQTEAQAMIIEYVKKFSSPVKPT